MGVLIPNTYLKDISKPLIFLAGPIMSAPNWQDKAIDIIHSKNPYLILVSPRRGVRDSFAQYVLKGDDNYFSRQRTWERHYIEHAVKKGAVMFWLPGEESHNCKKSYAAMTRFELGLVLGWYKYDKSISFCIGTDNLFSEIDTILCDFQIDAKDMKICQTLEETCAEVMKLALGNRNK